MGPTGAHDVDRAVAEMLQVLVPQQDRDWAVPAGPLEWSCWRTAAHVAHDLVAYAGQVAARPDDAYLPFDLTVRDGTSPRDVLRVVRAAGGLLAAAIRTAAPDARAWHWGPADPGGFAALGVNETLVHTWDVAQGLGLDWTPPAPLAAKVLARLFPDAPAGDPPQVLLWCTGRTALPGHPRRGEWRMRVALD